MKIKTNTNNRSFEYYFIVGIKVLLFLVFSPILIPLYLLGRLGSYFGVDNK